MATRTSPPALCQAKRAMTGRSAPTESRTPDANSFFDLQRSGWVARWKGGLARRIDVGAERRRLGVPQAPADNVKRNLDDQANHRHAAHAWQTFGAGKGAAGGQSEERHHPIAHRAYSSNHHSGWRLTVVLVRDEEKEDKGAAQRQAAHRHQKRACRHVAERARTRNDDEDDDCG